MLQSDITVLSSCHKAASRQNRVSRQTYRMTFDEYASLAATSTDTKMGASPASIWVEGNCVYRTKVASHSSKLFLIYLHEPATFQSKRVKVSAP